MLIMGSLFIMLVLTVFSIVLGSGWASSPINLTVDNDAIVNGSSSSFIIEGEDLIFNIDPLTGAIAIIAVIGVIAIVAGLQILGSGLSDTSIRMGVLATVYTGIWVVLSVLALSLIFSIEVFGAIIYITLTLVYVVGVIQKMAGGND